MQPRERGLYVVAERPIPAEGNSQALAGHLHMGSAATCHPTRPEFYVAQPIGGLCAALPVPVAPAAQRPVGDHGKLGLSGACCQTAQVVRA